MKESDFSCVLKEVRTLSLQGALLWQVHHCELVNLWEERKSTKRPLEGV